MQQTLVYLSRSRSRSLSRSLLWLRMGDCPLAMEWCEMGGDALAGLEEEVVEEELLVDRSRPPPLPPPPVLPLLLCLMPLSSMPCPFPPVTSFHSCWSSAGLRPAAQHRQVKERGETKLHALRSGHNACFTGARYFPSTFARFSLTFRPIALSSSLFKKT